MSGRCRNLFVILAESPSIIRYGVCRVAIHRLTSLFKPCLDMNSISICRSDIVARLPRQWSTDTYGGLDYYWSNDEGNVHDRPRLSFLMVASSLLDTIGPDPVRNPEQSRPSASGIFALQKGSQEDLPFAILDDHPPTPLSGLTKGTTEGFARDLKFAFRTAAPSIEVSNDIPLPQRHDNGFASLARRYASCGLRTSRLKHVACVECRNDLRRSTNPANHANDSISQSFSQTPAQPTPYTSPRVELHGWQRLAAKIAFHQGLRKAARTDCRRHLTAVSAGHTTTDNKEKMDHFVVSDSALGGWCVEGVSFSEVRRTDMPFATGL